MDGVTTVRHVMCGGDALLLVLTLPQPLLGWLGRNSFAGFLRRKSVELVPCKNVLISKSQLITVDFVLGGYVQPGEMQPDFYSAITPVITQRLKIILFFNFF